MRHSLRGARNYTRSHAVEVRCIKEQRYSIRTVDTAQPQPSGHHLIPATTYRNLQQHQLPNKHHVLSITCAHGGRAGAVPSGGAQGREGAVPGGDGAPGREGGVPDGGAHDRARGEASAALLTVVGDRELLVNLAERGQLSKGDGRLVCSMGMCEGRSAGIRV